MAHPRQTYRLHELHDFCELPCNCMLTGSLRTQVAETIVEASWSGRFCLCCCQCGRADLHCAIRRLAMKALFKGKARLGTLLNVLNVSRTRLIFKKCNAFSTPFSLLRLVRLVRGGFGEPTCCRLLLAASAVILVTRNSDQDREIREIWERCDPLPQLRPRCLQCLEAKSCQVLKPVLWCRIRHI